MHGLKYVKSYIHIYNCNDACPITISFAWTRILLLHYLTLTNLVWISFCCYTAQKMKFSIKDFFSTCDQIRKKLRIWSHLLKKSLMENFIFCAVLGPSIWSCSSPYAGLQVIKNPPTHWRIVNSNWYWTHTVSNFCLHSS